ncbi:hypothetical protein ACSQ67_026154 [Phaseolus vulgaris]
MTLRCLEKCRDGGFEEVFMTYAVKYDYCMRINLKGKEVFAMGFCLDDECWRSYEDKIPGILSKGLNDRAKVIQVTWRNTQCQWSVDDGLSVFDKEPLFIGISVSTLEKAYRMVDIGPNAEMLTHDLKQALEFQKFWGEKAELRRFKDGRVAESTGEASIVITLHLENIVVVVDQLDFSLLHGAGDPISYSGSLLGAFDVSSKRLRLIEDLPLKALKVMIQLEGSGNWPMDEIAIEETKPSFLFEIGLSLQKTWACTATEDNVDVLILAKRWAASHLFSACMVEEAVELLVAYLFLNPLPFDVPCLRITGFLRTSFLAKKIDQNLPMLSEDIEY